MKVKIGHGLIKALEKKRIYLRPQFHFGDSLNKVINVRNTVTAETYSRIPEASLIWDGPVSIGAFSYLVQNSNLADSTIGRHCSIATGVNIIGQSHPIDRVTTSTWTYGENIRKLLEEDFGASIKQDRKVPSEKGVQIGNDVWIAQNVTFKRGLVIGDGAVVAANSMVTKNVPPYAIVGGNPAKIIKYRFEHKTIDKLLELKWWNYSPESLAKMNLTDIDEFIEQSETYNLDKNYNYTQEKLSELFIKHGEVT